jgi:hypothetical protein
LLATRAILCSCLAPDGDYEASQFLLTKGGDQEIRERECNEEDCYSSL